MELTDQQHLAIDLLLQGTTHRETAREVGVSRSTISNWLNKPAFAAELSTLRSDRRLAVKSHLDHATVDAVRVLHDLVLDEDQKGIVRVRACAEILDRAGITSKATVEIQHTTPEPRELEETVREKLQSRLRVLTGGQAE